MKNLNYKENENLMKADIINYTLYSKFICVIIKNLVKF